MRKNNIQLPTEFKNQISEKLKDEYAKKNDIFIRNTTDIIIIIFNIFYFLNILIFMKSYDKEMISNNFSIVGASLFSGFIFISLIFNRIFLQYYNNEVKFYKQRKCSILINIVKKLLHYNRLFILQVYCFVAFIYFFYNDYNHDKSSFIMNLDFIFKIRLYNINALALIIIYILNFDANIKIMICIYIISIIPVTVYSIYISNLIYIFTDYFIIFFLFSLGYFIRKKFDIFIKKYLQNLSKIEMSEINFFAKENEKVFEQNNSLESFYCKENLSGNIISLNLKRNLVNFISDNFKETLVETFKLNNIDEQLNLFLEDKKFKFSLDANELVKKDKKLELLVNIFFNNTKLIKKGIEFKELFRNDENSSTEKISYLNKFDSLTKIFCEKNFNFFQDYIKNIKINNEDDTNFRKFENKIENSFDKNSSVHCRKFDSDKEKLQNENCKYFPPNKVKTLGIKGNQMNEYLSNKNNSDLSNLIPKNVENLSLLNINKEEKSISIIKENQMKKIRIKEQRLKKLFSKRINNKDNINQFSNNNLSTKNKHIKLINSNSELNNTVNKFSNMFDNSTYIQKYKSNDNKFNVKNKIKENNNLYQNEKIIGVFLLDPLEILNELSEFCNNSPDKNNYLEILKEKITNDFPYKKYFEISFTFMLEEINESSLIDNENKNDNFNIILSVTDVTRFYQSYEKIILRNEYSFVKMSKLIHEFKTPLNCIIGLSNQINDIINCKDFNSEEFKDNVEKIFNLSNYTIFLIRDLTRFLTNEINYPKNQKSKFLDADNNLTNNIKIVNVNKLPSDKTNKNYLNVLDVDKNSKNSNSLIQKDSKKTEQITTIEYAITPHHLCDILNFSFSILSVLIKCSKIKKENIQPLLKIEKEFENILIFTNEIKLKQILINLISNSVKFTHSGVIILQANFKNETKEFIEISIIDSGIGINKSEQHKIFKDFADIKIKNNQKNLIENNFGTGLGLSLSKNFAQLLGLDLIYDNKYKEGTKFSIIVPSNKFKMERNSQEFKISVIGNKSTKENCNPLKYSTNILTKGKDQRNLFVKNNTTIRFNNTKRDNILVNSTEILKNNLSYLKNSNGKKIKNPLDNNLNIDQNYSRENEVITINSKNSFNKSESNNSSSIKLKLKKTSKTKFNFKSSKELKSIRLQQELIGEFPLLKYSKDQYDKAIVDSKICISDDTLMDIKVKEIVEKIENIAVNSGEIQNNIDLKDEKHIDDSKSIATKLYGMNFNFDFNNRYSSFIKNLKISGNSEIRKVDSMESSVASKFNKRKSKDQRKLSSNEGEIIHNRREEEMLIYINKNQLDFDLNSANNNFSYRSYNNPIKKSSKRVRYNLRVENENINSNRKESSFLSIELFQNLESEKSDKSINLIDHIKKKKILIADDNEILLNTLCKMLNDLIRKLDLNFELICCRDGLDILNNVIQDQFNGNMIQLIITDENMEFIKGSDAIKILRDLNQRNKIKEIPVVFVTSYDDIYSLGAPTNGMEYKIISKPINYKTLEAVLYELEIITVHN